MVSPYMENGNIATYIEQLEEAKENVPRERWATEIARGLQYLHQEQVVHGDLRGVNILVDSDMHVRLADFGLSMLVDSNPLSNSPSRNGGAGRWSAPELIQGSQVSFKSDIWAFACVCIQIYTRLPPFGHLSDWQVIRHIMDGDLPEKPPPDTGIRQYLLNLLDMCLKPDPKARPNASSLVRVLSRCSPVPEKRVTMELAPARQKPLPATPPDTDSDDKSATPPTNEQKADSDASAPSSSTHSRNPSDEALHVLHHRHHLASMSPLSQQSFVIVPSTPSSNSLDSNVFLPSSPSHSHSIESNIVVSGPSSACSHVSHFPSSPSASSDVSSGYDMVVDANAVDVGSQCYLYL